MTVYQNIVPIPTVVIVDKKIEVDWKISTFDSSTKVTIYANAVGIWKKFNQSSIT